MFESLRTTKYIFLVKMIFFFLEWKVFLKNNKAFFQFFCQTHFLFEDTKLRFNATQFKQQSRFRGNFDNKKSSLKKIYIRLFNDVLSQGRPTRGPPRLFWLARKVFCLFFQNVQLRIAREFSPLITFFPFF